jgi:manganese/zinc/iron transport system permease protein
VLDLFDDYTLRTVALGSAALGLTSGALGSFAVLRRQSLLGDAISHAALPGVAVAFLLTGSKAPLVLVAGAALAGFLGTLLVMSVVRTTRVKYDTALGIVLSVFFGFGLVLLTFIQRRPDASQAGLDRFLFGQAAGLLRRDLVTMAILGGLALGVMLLVWKELKLLAFDPDYGTSLGFPMRALDVLLTSLLVVAIVIGLQTVGVVLMAAMVIAPFAAARQWTDRLGVAAGLAAAFGATAGIVGSILSSEAERLPTGPTIVLCATAIALGSIVLAGRRGLLWQALRGRRDRRRLRLAAVLGDLLALEQQHPDESRGHSAAVLSVMSGGAGSSLEELERRGQVRRLAEDSWQLTDAGREEAEEE